MDGGSYRAPRPADGRVINGSRQQPQAQPPRSEEPQAVRVEPEPIQHRQAPVHHTLRSEKQPKKRFKLPLIIAVVAVAVALAGYFAISSMQSGGTAIDGSKYQAVFFTNGQVYFGKLKSFNDQYLKLTDVYYLQTQAGAGADSENPQQTSTDQSNVQLIKLGNEIHGPEDAMVISKDQVLFYENLKDEGNVAQSIKKYKDTN